MDQLGYFLDILKYTIAGVIVFFVGWFFVRTYIQEIYGHNLMEIKKASLEQTLPLRLQAYERTILFLERINPANMLVRLHVSGMSAHEMHSIILSDIRSEYQHNIAQQIYVGNTAWSLVKKMKEDTVIMVNDAVHSLPENASAIDLSKAILTHMANLKGDNPYDLALTIVKRDIQQLF